MTTYTHDSSGDLQVGNKEYYSNVIKDISPMSTPLFNLFGEENVDSVVVQQYTENLRSPDPSNDQALDQGGTPTAEDESRILMQNRTQIFAKKAEVSDTQEVVKKVGVKSELDHRGKRVLAALKKDYEARCMAGVHYRDPATSSTASLMMGMAGTIARFSDEANGGTVGSANYGADNTTNVCITQENFDNSGSLGAKSKFLDMHEGVFTLGSEADTCVMSPKNARYMSAWDTSGATRQYNDPRKLIDNVEAFESPFGVVKRVMNRTLSAYSDNGTDSFDGVTGEAIVDFAFIITPSLWKRRPLKGYDWQSEELGRTGPLKWARNYKYQGSLTCLNPGGEVVFNFAGWASHNHQVALPTTAAGYVL